MPEAAGAIILGDSQMFVSDLQRPAEPPDRIANAFYDALQYCNADAKGRPLTPLPDQLNALMLWATSKEAQSMPPHLGNLTQSDLLVVREQLTIAKKFILHALEPLDTLANILMVNDARADALGITLSQEQCEYVALMNQRLARGFFAATVPGAPRELRENAELFIQFFNGLKQRNAGFGDLGKIHIAGAIGQAKAMQIFNNIYYFAYVPKDQEIATWEPNAADMVVWPKGKRNIIKVDVKGGIMIAPEVIVTSTGESKADKAMLASLIPLIRNDLGDTINRFPIPTHVLSVRLKIPVDLKANPLGKLDPQATTQIQDSFDSFDRL